MIDNNVAGDQVILDSNTQATINGSGGSFDVNGQNVAVTASYENGDESSNSSLVLSGINNVIELGSNDTFNDAGSAGT